MPTYDFKCKQCKKKFTVTTAISALAKVKCPKCNTRRPDRVFETFVAVTRKKS